MTVSIEGQTPGITVDGEGAVVNVTVTTGNGGGGGSLPSGTAGQVPQVQSGSTYVLVTPNTANGLVRLDGSATIPDILHPSSIARDSEVTAAVATRTTPADVDAQIESYHLPFNATTRAHIPVANFGGTVGGGTATIAAFAAIPTGRTLWLQGQTDSADDGFYTALGAGEFELSDVQPLGSATYVGREIVVGVDSEFGFAPTLWVVSSDGVTVSATRSAVRPDQLTTILDDYALSTDVTTEIATALADYVTTTDLGTTLADYALDATVDTDRTASNLADALQAQATAFAGEITRVFRFDGAANSRWETPSLTSEFVDGIEIRALVVPRRSINNPWFHEILTQPHDSETGAWDNFELAILDPDTSFFLDGDPMVQYKPYLFWEQTLDGGSDESGDFVAEAPIQWGNPVEVMLDVDFTATRRRLWLRVPYDLGDGATYHTSAVDAAVFRLVKSEVTAEWASLDAHTEVWWLGFQFGGDIARVWARNGLDGTLVADPDASLVTPGATSFNDGVGNPWTGQVGAQVVSLEPGGTVDVVSNVAADRILGRVSSGTGDSEELTAGQARSLLGVPFRVVVDRTIGAGGSASESFDVTGLTVVRVLFVGNSERASAQDSLRMTFNNDTGSVYSTDSGALTTFLTVAALPGQLTNADRGGWCEAELHLLDGFTKSGVSRATNIGSTAAVGQAVVHRGLFSTITAAVTSIELYMANADIAAGSRLIVLGA